MLHWCDFSWFVFSRWRVSMDFDVCLRHTGGSTAVGAELKKIKQKHLPRWREDRACLSKEISDPGTNKCRKQTRSLPDTPLSCCDIRFSWHLRILVPSDSTVALSCRWPRFLPYSSKRSSDPLPLVLPSGNNRCASTEVTSSFCWLSLFWFVGGFDHRFSQTKKKEKKRKESRVS